MPKSASLQLFDPDQAEKVRPYVERILSSETFRKAPNLRNLLQYLVAGSNAGHVDQLKESVIAIEVFGRRTDFDGRIDNIVRVQAHRLRKYLDTYYEREGKDEKLRLSVPRGGYIPQFIDVQEAPAGARLPCPEGETVEISEVLSGSQVTVPIRRFGIAWQAAFACTFLAGVFAALLFVNFRGQPAPPRTPVVEFWKSIFGTDARVIVSYTNPVFLRVGRSPTYLLYQGPLSAPAGTQINIADSDPRIDPQYASGKQPLFFSDGWTGTGEVLGVNRLTELAAQFGKGISVIPSRALTLEQVHAANVIFLGSPWMNGVLAQTGNDDTPMYNTNDSKIVIRNPKPGDPAIYENGRDPVTGETKFCYALFSVLPGINASRKVVNSAGLGTMATWGAIDYLTSAAGTERLLGILKTKEGRLPDYFQAVIRSEIIKGSVSGTSLVVARAVPRQRLLRR